MKKLFIISLVSVLLVTGCWDQRLLVKRTLVNGISYDLTDEGNILASVRALHIQSLGGGQFELHDELVDAERPTITGVGLDIDSRVSGEIDASKAHIVIIGEELAKRGIHPFIEFFYRNRDSFLSSKVIISKGKAKSVLSVEKEKSPIAFAILQLLEGAEADTTIQEKKTYNVWNNILDPGKDMVLPYVERVKSDKVEVAGVALFNRDRYSGITLPKEKGSLLLPLMNHIDKTNRMALVLDPERIGVSFATRDISRNLEVEVDKKENITCKVNLTMDIELLTYPQDFKNEINIKKLNQELSKEFTKQAKEITNTLLEANCDALGIGRHISSFHPDLWKKINWDEEYKNVQFEPKVKVNIIKTGNVF